MRYLLVLCAACSPMYPPPMPAEPTQPGEPALADLPPDPAVDPSAEPSPPDPEFAAPGKRTPARGAGPASSMAQAMVDAHNRFRAKHCAGPLTWSPKLAKVAQQWANSLRDQGCKFGHSGGTYGENLAAGTSGVLDAEAVVKMWYDEVSQYRFPDGGFSAATGHFTQVVWRRTTQLGCARSVCKGMDIWVCEYDPPGNWEGQYRDNVRAAGACR